MIERTKNVMFLHAGAEMYGADRIFLELLRGCASRGIRPTVVLPSGGPLVGAIQEAGIDVEVFSLAILRRKYFTPSGILNRAWRLMHALLFLRRVVKANNIDVVYSNTTAVIVGVLLAQWLKLPHIWHVHEITLRPRPIVRAISWLMFKVPGRVVAVSRAVKEHLESLEPRLDGRVTVVYNGIDGRVAHSASGASIRQELKIDSDVPLVGMVGRVNRWKGQRALLDAFVSVRASVPNARLVMVGGTFEGEERYMRELRDEVARLALGDSVTIWEYRDDVAAILDAMDVFVLPSTEPDPLPTVVLEAMHAGKVVVGFAHGGVCEMVEATVTGLLVPPGDVDQLGAAIGELILNPDRRISMGNAGRNRVRQQFSKERFLDVMEKLIKVAAESR